MDGGGGEQGGVWRSSTLGDKALARAGENGGWAGGWLVGLMPRILGQDINRWVGGGRWVRGGGRDCEKKFSTTFNADQFT